MLFRSQNEPIEKRKSALIQLKAIYSDNVALQKLEVTTNQAYINTLINQAAQQENAVSRQKNTQKQLEAYYKTEKELQEATSKGDAKKVDSLTKTIESQKMLLEATKNTLAEFTR